MMVVLVVKMLKAMDMIMVMKIVMKLQIKQNVLLILIANGM